MFIAKMFKVHWLLLPFQIIEEIDNNDIHIYEFPDCDSDEDDDFKQQDRELKVSVCLKVVAVSATEMKTTDQKQICTQCQNYAWCRY